MTRHALLLVAALASVPSLAAAQSQPQSPVTTIVIDLTDLSSLSADYSSRLQFDVPLKLIAKIAAQVKQATFRRADRPCGIGNDADFGRIGSWQPGQPSPVFMLSPLDANRDMCLKAELAVDIPSDRASEFIALMIPVLDQELRGLRVDPNVGGVIQASIDHFRESLSKALRTAGRAFVTTGILTFDTDSMFGDSPNSAALASFIALLRDELDATVNRQSILGDIQSQLTPTGDWIASADLQAFRAAAEKAKDPVAIQLRSLQDSVILFRNGLNGLWDAKSVDDLAAQSNLASWNALLGQIAVAIRGVSPNTGSYLNFSRARLEALAKAGDDAATYLEAINKDLLSPGGLRDRFSSRANRLSDLARQLHGLVLSTATLNATTRADFQTRAGWYVGVDLGLGVAPALQATFPYVGVNLYFRPVNKQALLSERNSFGRRFSVMLGTTYGTDLTDGGKRENTANPGMLLIAPGIRLTDLIRAAVGVMILKAPDQSTPLLTTKKLQWAMFYSISIDWDARTTFQNILGSNGQPTVTVPPQ